jgi:hypothetical protein
MKRFVAALAVLLAVASCGTASSSASRSSIPKTWQVVQTIGTSGGQTWRLYARRDGHTQVCMNIYLVGGPPEPSAHSLDDTALCAPTPGQPLQDPLVVFEGLDQSGNPGAVGGVAVDRAMTIQFTLVDGSLMAVSAKEGFFLVPMPPTHLQSALLIDHRRRAFARCRIDYQKVLGPVVETCTT